jgi:hypothetical protein
MCSKSSSVLLNHHLSSFDHGGDGVALLELEFVKRPTQDATLGEEAPTTSSSLFPFFLRSLASAWV